MMNRAELNLIQKHALVSPLNIPEGKSGKWSIAHETIKAGAEIDVINFRKSLLTGVAGLKHRYEADRRVHKLLYDTGVIMSDLPVEMADHLEFFLKAHGTVLIGGLGLGYIATKLLENKKVKKIVVVEKSNNVIELVKPHLDKSITIVHRDLFRYVNNPVRMKYFDTAYYDIWTGTGESTWMSHVVPLRRLSTKANPELKLWCWQEEVMQGQVAGPFGGVYKTASLVEEHPWLPSRVFQAAVKEVGLKLRPISIGKAPYNNFSFQESIDIEEENRANPKLQALVGMYLFTIGTLPWEDLFGKYWDKFKKEKK